MQDIQKPGKTKTQLIRELEDCRRRLTELEASHQELLLTMQSLRDSEERYRILLDESSDPIFTFYPDGTYRYVNQAFARGVNRCVDEIIGRKIWDVFPKDEADKRYAVLHWVFEHGETKVFEVRVPRNDGDIYFITTVKPVFDEQGGVKSVICISKEITDRKAVERELLHLSTHDTLTGLYNRNFFEVELARIQHSRLFPVSIVILDLDNLKSVNDCSGHASGDELLRVAADLIRQAIRVEDIAARIGGDEFAVILAQTDEDDTQQVVERLRSLVEKQPDRLLSLSMGAATGMEGDDLLEVLRVADDRMYREKQARKLES